MVLTGKSAAVMLAVRDTARGEAAAAAVRAAVPRAELEVAGSISPAWHRFVAFLKRLRHPTAGSTS